MADQPDIFDVYNATPGAEGFYRPTGAFEGPTLPRLEKAVRGSEMMAGKVSGLMGKALKYVNHPAAVAAMFLPAGVGILRSLTKAARQAHEQDIYVNQLLNMEVEERAENRRRFREQQQRGMLRDENARRLAMYAPHLYNQVMAGRKLPKNAVVIGGTPRTDLLEELASSMADGAWGGE